MKSTRRGGDDGVLVKNAAVMKAITSKVQFFTSLLRFTFAEFCYSLLLVSDDLSNEQLMRCDDAERILAKRREALDIAAAAVPKSSSSLAAASASIAPESPNIVPDDSLNSYTPRSSRLLLFVQVCFV